MATVKYRDDTLTGLTLSTGKLSGGVGSVNTATSIDITAGTGIIVDNYTDTTNPNVTNISWNAFTNLTINNVATQPRTFYGINSAGTIIQQASNFTQEQKREIIPLGVALHLNFTSISAVSQRFYAPINPLLVINDLASALGPINVSGNIYSPNGANLNINRSGGEVFDIAANSTNDKNPNFVTTTTLTAASFQYQYQDGSSSFTTGGSTTTIDPTNYDDGTGTLASVASNRWSIQRIHQFSRTGNIRIEYGQQTYNSLADAESDLSTATHVQDDTLATNAVFRCYLILKGNATDLSNISEAKFIEVTSLGGGSSATVSAAPETNQQLDVLKGTAGTINVGDVVYLTGFSGGFSTVELADASSTSTTPAFGIAISTITDGVTGTVAFMGEVNNNLDTSAFAVGDDLFVSETAGQLTNTQPQGTALVQKFATVLESSATTGRIFVFGAGRVNALPNIPNNQFWLGDSNGVPQATDFNTEVSANSDVTANTAKVSNATHTGDVTGSTSLTITNDVVTNAKLANMPQNTLKGRITVSTGDPEDLTASQVRSIINVEDGADVTDAANVDSAGATMNTDTTLVGNGYFLDEDTMASNDPTKVCSQQSIKTYVDGEVSSSSTNDRARANHTGTQLMSTISNAGALATLNTVDTAQIDADAVTNVELNNMAQDTIKGRITAGTGNPEDLTAAQIRTIINVEDGADVTDSVNVDAAGATMNTDTDVSSNSWVLDEDTLTSDDATKVPTQQSVKAYVDGEISTSSTADRSRTNHTGTQDTSTIGSGTFADARIAESNVTQHEGAITLSALSGYVANEHIDWTSSSSNFNTTGTITGGGDVTIHEATNDGSPQIRLGSSDTNEFRIQTVYNTGTQELDYVLFRTETSSATANDGRYQFEVDESVVFEISDSGADVTGDLTVSDEAYGVGWNGSFEVPTKNAVYDKIESLSAGGISNVVEDTTPQLGGQLDVNGNSIGNGTEELIQFSETASAVNEITVTNAATSGSPSITASGDDANIDLTLDGKGTGVVKTLSSNLDITGNILVSGTVDGRDVATDGAKLDNITVTQAVDLDTLESDVATNNSKISATTANVDSAGATMNTDTTLVGNGYFLDEDTMASNDATKVCSQQSIKAYVDSASTDDRARANHTGSQLMSTISDAGALATLNTIDTAQIDNNAVTNAKAADMLQNTIKGRITASTGDPEDLTASQVRSIINVEDGADVTDAANVDAAGATMNTDTDVSSNSWVLDEDTLTSDDATKVPTQQSVKAYVDTASTNDRARSNHTGSQTASTISDFAATVRSTVLTGLSTTTDTDTTATDTVLQAIGKLQAQLNNLELAHIGLNAGAFVSRTTNGATSGTLEYTTNDIDLDYFDFSNSTEQGAIVSFVMPDEWDGGTVRFKVHYGGTSSVTWGIAGRSYGNAESIDQSWGTEVTAADTGASSLSTIYVSDASGAMTFAGTPAGGEKVSIRVVLKTTTTADARLFDLHMQYGVDHSNVTAWT